MCIAGAGGAQVDGDTVAVDLLLPSTTTTAETIFYRDDLDLVDEGEEDDEME